MDANAALIAVSRRRAASDAVIARLGLTAIVAVSFVTRVIAAARHPVPRYFPDEYIYTALARSLGSHGTPSIRGASSHFPALLEPVLAAPLQAAFSPEAAYRLTQLENALCMSLAAVPVFLLARRLSLSTGYALACAAFAVAIPDLVFASYTLADPVAYPLALAALAAALAAVDRPSRQAQLVFLGFAVAAMLTRIQYVVLVPAFVGAALVVDGRRSLRSQRLPLAVLGLGSVAALALGTHRVLGAYSGIFHVHHGPDVLRWAATDAFLLAIASGVVLVPGAVAAVVRPRGRTQGAFAVLFGVLAVGLFAEAALFARFQERYLFVLLPLVPIAFGVYLRNGRPARLLVAALSLLLLIVSARVPLSGYAASLGKTDSPFLVAVFRLEALVGTANGSLLVAAFVAVAALSAIGVSRGGDARVAFAATIFFVAASTLGATASDSTSARNAQRDFVASDPSWVDTTGLKDVTLVQTAGSPPAGAVEQLYWNRAVNREVLLGEAAPTDSYAAPTLRIAPDGTLLGVPGPVLFQGEGATATFANATPVARFHTFRLWSPHGAPRLRLLEEGRYADGWLAQAGRLTVWPNAGGHTIGTVHFSLSLPLGSQPVTLTLAGANVQIRPGQATELTYTIDKPGPWSLSFSASAGSRLPDLRVVSVRSSVPVFRPTRRVPGTAASAAPATDLTY